MLKPVTRICHVNLAKDYRGGERQTELLIRELAAREWSQRLIIRKGQELAERCEDVDNLEIVADISNPLTAAWATKGSSLIHAHEARAAYAGWYGTTFYKIPSMLTRRVVKRQNRSWLRDSSYRAAGAIAAVSRAAAAAIRQTYVDIDPIIVPDACAGLPVDAENVIRLREDYAGHLLIGHVGSYDHSAKGQLTIIDVAKRAATERPEWHFLLLGAGRDEGLFRERIGDLHNIELVGFVDNVGDYMSAFDVFVFPSLHEAMGSSVLDAMQFGLPVVASNVGGLPEFVESGINGVLIEPESVDELFDGIVRVVDDKDLANAMHLANRARASDYSVSRMADAYESIYRSLI